MSQEMIQMGTKQPKTPFRKPAIAMSLAALLVLLISCNLPGMIPAPSTPLQAATPLPPQNTSVPVQASPLAPSAQPPTDTPAPTLTPTPTATLTPSPVNIVFAPGTTAAEVHGTIQPNQVQTFLLSAGQYQPMILILNSGKGDVYLGVAESNGNILLDPAKKWTNWQWLLPKTEVYTINVYGGSIAEDFTLTAKVAARIKFAAGATSATLGGTTLKGYVFSYGISCQANQTMTVSINVPATSAYIDIFGLATGTLLSSSAKATTWTGTLPATEDYIIEVVPVNGQVVNYTITVSVH
jgi:hypothetical protein